MRTFEIGDRIIYRTKGVCTVVDVVKKAFSGYEEKEYYVVESVSADHYRSYVPVDSPTASLIKLVPSVAEVDEMIERSTRLCPEYETDKKKRESCSQYTRCCIKENRRCRKYRRRTSK